jgi:hypothetical protein
LGSMYLPKQLRAAGLEVIAQDDVKEYQDTERDPWLFYKCGKQGMIAVTSDTKLFRSFPHMAAIALGKTTVIAFTNNNYNSDIRGRAFIKALPQIEKAIRAHRRRKAYFVGIVGMQGSFRVAQEKPLPHRILCDPRDWASFERVCAAEGVLALAPQHWRECNAKDKTTGQEIENTAGLQANGVGSTGNEARATKEEEATALGVWTNE